MPFRKGRPFGLPVPAFFFFASSDPVSPRCQQRRLGARAGISRNLTTRWAPESAALPPRPKSPAARCAERVFWAPTDLLIQYGPVFRSVTGPEGKICLLHAQTDVKTRVFTTPFGLWNDLALPCAQSESTRENPFTVPFIAPRLNSVETILPKPQYNNFYMVYPYFNDFFVQYC